MTADRTHRAVSADGTEIAGRVHGQGPPLVLVHGSLDDGDTIWGALLPLLTDRFTCYCLSTRGRGLSADSDDHSPARLVDDVVAFLDGIGDAAALMGHSSGAGLALGAAARSAAVSGVVAYEPAVPPVINPDDLARVQAAIAHHAELAAQGQLADAARILFTESPMATDNEAAAMAAAGHFEAMAPYVPLNLTEMQQAAESPDPNFADPSVLKHVDAPVLLLHGSETDGSWATESVRHLAGHLPDARVHEVPDAAHFGPLLAPEQVAKEATGFLAPARQQT